MHFRTPSLLAAPLLAASALAHTTSHDSTHSVKNFIYVVPDGFGHASQVLARDYASLIQNGGNISAPMSAQLPHDKLVIGSVRTQASDDLVTDSAAAATAFSAGFKSYNGAIGVKPDEQPVASILEAAHLAGLKTGLVATSRITHATPGAYAAHVLHRDFEAKIAEHQIGYSHPFGSVVDVLMGGGLCFYQPSSTKGSCRDDSVDLLGYAKGKGFNVFTDRSGFDKLSNGTKAKLPYLGLFAKNHMSYDIDRDPSKQPSLLEMAQTAITSLHEATKNRKQGFFIMIEASRIDHAGHANDPVGHLYDIQMYNQVLDYIRGWIDEHGNTEFLSAADHETGGLTLMDAEPVYNPLLLRNATSSTEPLAAAFKNATGNLTEFLLAETFPAYGITPDFNISQAEIKTLIDLQGNSAWPNALGNIFSLRAGINWSTFGHSASDVALVGYAKGDGYKAMKAEFGGNHDNTDMPKYIESRLGLNLKGATKRLVAKGTDFVQVKDGKGKLRKRSLVKGCGHAHD